jgi:hypothetical protein
MIKKTHKLRSKYHIVNWLKTYAENAKVNELVVVEFLVE